MPEIHVYGMKKRLYGENASRNCVTSISPRPRNEVPPVREEECGLICDPVSGSIYTANILSAERLDDDKGYYLGSVDVDKAVRLGNKQPRLIGVEDTRDDLDIFLNLSAAEQNRLMDAVGRLPSNERPTSIPGCEWIPDMEATMRTKKIPGHFVKSPDAAQRRKPVPAQISSQPGS